MFVLVKDRNTKRLPALHPVKRSRLFVRSDVVRISAFLLLCLLTTKQVFASAESESPQSTLDAYFQVLTSRDISKLAGLMDSTNMAKLKGMMDIALQEELRVGGNRLQRRLFGKSMTLVQIERVTATYYLEQVAGDIQKAANGNWSFLLSSNKA